MIKNKPYSQLLLFILLTISFSVTFMLADALPLSGVTELVSVSSSGTQGNGDSAYLSQPRMSADGRFVVFESEASNLVPGDSNNPSVFLRDRLLGVTEIIPSTEIAYSSLPDVSDDGRFVAFTGTDGIAPGDTNGHLDVLLYDRETGETQLISQREDGVLGDDGSSSPKLSGNGRYIVFWTTASNLIAGVDTSGVALIYDRLTDTLSVGSVAYDGSPAWGGRPNISDNGQIVMFRTQSSGVVPDDTNDAFDVFIHDRTTGETERVVSATGEEGDGNSYSLDLSPDGRYVLFQTWATNLIGDGAGQLLLYDRQTKEIEIASRNTEGELANASVPVGVISATGRYVAFGTSADNLVDNDTNLGGDTFIHDRETGWTALVSVNLMGNVGIFGGFYPAISANGEIVAFSSASDDLVPVDTNGTIYDVFVRELDFPTLGVNYTTGAPGSYFTFTGAGSLVTDTITVTVNSQAIGTIPIAPDGSYEFILSTAGADVGHYTVGVIAPFADEVAVFWLDPQAPVRPMEGSGVVLVVPAGIAQHLRFFPVVQRPLVWP